MKNEKFYVAPLSALLSFLLFLALIVCVNGFNILNYVLSPKSLMDSVDISELIDEAKEESFDEEEVHSQIEGIDDKDFEELFDEVFSKEFTSYYIESVLEASFYGESSYDSDEMYDLIEDETEDFFEEHDEIPKSEREAFIQGLVDVCDETIIEAQDAHDDEEAFEYIDKARSIINMAALIAFVVAAFCVGILFAIYKNKGRSLVSSGRSAMISQALSALGIFGIKIILFKFLADVPKSDRAMANIFKALVNNVTLKSLVIVGVVFAVGLVLVITGSVLSKEYNNDDFDDFDDDDYSQPRPQPQPQVKDYLPYPYIDNDMPRSSYQPIPCPVPPPPIRRD